MHLFKWIGDGLLYLVALPIFAFQSLEMLSAITEFFAEVSGYIRYK
ncbi:MAG TPA: hypothetical protein VJ824_11280 [Bacillota bacterium]|nr:hypothetical protein [Bacillota bacterium]